MRLLLEGLSHAASALIESADNGRADFRIDAGILRRGLFDNGYAELAVTGTHAAALAGLPPIHKDPFDRMLVAQAIVEGIHASNVGPGGRQISGIHSTGLTHGRGYQRSRGRNRLASALRIQNDESVA